MFSFPEPSRPNAVHPRVALPGNGAAPDVARAARDV
jgi:hypothetical protein